MRSLVINFFQALLCGRKKATEMEVVFVGEYKNTCEKNLIAVAVHEGDKRELWLLPRSYKYASHEKIIKAIKTYEEYLAIPER